ncbi:unnamed protein product [Lactuca virosa]|uniref:Uncharacterized protein n=1 Tax=Lactuca virosa TaxID=75947 RepID=A0AAU9MRR0_9ASTR|nr:unnamed protein product [Lactuca virosa]
MKKQMKKDGLELEVELSGLLDATCDTQTKMVKMSALNHLMSTHVLQHAQQIECLYDRVRNSNILDSLYKCG